VRGRHGGADVPRLPTTGVLYGVVRGHWGDFARLVLLTAYRNISDCWKKKVHDLVTIATEGRGNDVDS
jgi:hypothetical protein